MRLTALIVIAVWLPLAAARAETGYINDEFEITLRSGESTQHSIVRMLPTGTRLDILSENAETGYSQVRTDNGATGYVLTRFITEQPAARDRLARLQARFDQLREDQTAEGAQLTRLREELQQVEAQRDSLEERNAELDEELDRIRRTSANALNIDRQNNTLTMRLEQSEATITRLENENALLASRNSQRWFIIGAAAVLIGALLGFLLPRLRWRKRSKWGDL